MQKTYSVAIIGGGFSGLVCAETLSCKFGGENVLLIEKNDRVGKKILATGNGRGNFTNLDLSPEKYHSVCGASVSKILNKYGNKSIIDYFKGLGVDYSTENGKVYPSSFQANSLLDMLRLKLDYLKTEIKTASRVEKVVKVKGGFKIIANEEYFAKTVIFACGGKASKQYGTDGTSYAILEELGHTVTKLYPSLVQVKTDTSKIKGLKGLKQEADISVIRNGKSVVSFRGDVLFTDFGVSGNAVFYASAYLPTDTKCKLSISFLPEKSKQEIEDFIVNKFKNLPYLSVEECLTGVINKQIGKAIIKDCGNLSKNQKSASIIAQKVKDFTLDVKGTLGFDNAQVTKGGIRFSEVCELTLQSKLVSGLFIVGEALDVDGDCGGYNLQWAYSSAKTACDGVIDYYENR